MPEEHIGRLFSRALGSAEASFGQPARLDVVERPKRFSRGAAGPGTTSFTGGTVSAF